MIKNYKYITDTFGKRVKLYKIGPKSWARMSPKREITQTKDLQKEWNNIQTFICK